MIFKGRTSRESRDIDEREEDDRGHAGGPRRQEREHHEFLPMQRRAAHHLAEDHDFHWYHDHHDQSHPSGHNGHMNASTVGRHPPAVDSLTQSEEGKHSHIGPVSDNMPPSVQGSVVNGEPEGPEEMLSEPPLVSPRITPRLPDSEVEQLFRWMLEEKRKIKAEGKAEKHRLDADKRLLKDIIKAKAFAALR